MITLTVIPDAVAAEGAALAQRLQTAGARTDGALERYARAECSRLKRDKKALPQLKAEYEAAAAAGRQVGEEAETFEAVHGLSVVDAWEAHHAAGWPYYKVDSRADRSPRYTAESRVAR